MRATVVCLGLAVGCGRRAEGPGPSDNPRTLTDTTGAEFGWRCNAIGCEIDRLPTTPEPPECLDGVSSFTITSARFVSIAGSCVDPDGSWVSFGSWHRPAACAMDSDCPQLYGFSDNEYQCRNDLCQNTDTIRFPPEEIQMIDVELLCYAPHDRSATDQLGSEIEATVTAQVSAACNGIANPFGLCELPLPDGCTQP